MQIARRNNRLRLDQLETTILHGVDPVSRRIYLHSEISAESVAVAIRAIYSLAAMGNEPIELFVCSIGGDMDEAFALHDVTRTVKVPVYTVAIGQCKSAAPLLVSCGTPGERYATENTTFMLHDVSMDPGYDSVRGHLSQIKNLQTVRERYLRALERYSSMPKRHWRNLFDRKSDTHFDAERALEWGIIDGIWSEKD